MAVAGGAEEVKLLGVWASPYVWRARIALNIKGVRYEYKEEALGSKSELLLNSNPVHKAVPVLLHDGNPVCESMIVVQYIDDVWSSTGPSILPSDPYARALSRFWAAYVDDKWAPLLRVLLKLQTAEVPMAEAAEQIVSGLMLLEDVFKKNCEGKGFFGGETIGYLDISLGSFLAWIRVAEEVEDVKLLDEARMPLIAGWTERFRSDDAVMGVLPEISKLVAYCIMLRAKIGNATSPN